MNYIKTLCLCASLVWLAGCSSDDPKTSEVTTEINAPAGISDLQITNGTYIFTNKTTQVPTQLSHPLPANTRLADGLYDVTFTGEGTYTKATASIKIQGIQENVVVEGGNCKISLKVHVQETGGDFVISEIYYTGSAYAVDPTTGKQKQYNGDQYIVIYNNSDQTLYADGLGIAESAFRTSSKQDYTPNIVDEAITVHALFVIPGSGTDHPVKPGESITICDNAMNHKEADGSFMDLSKANFEWYTQSTSASYPDIDNPAVPNLDLYYCYTLTVYVFNKQGNSGYALVRMGADKDKWLADYTYEANYINQFTGKPTALRKYYKVPNTWVVDAVEVSFPDKHEWLVYSPSLDMGTTYVGEAGSTVTAFGKSVKRKELYTNPDGRVVLKDTNNSTDDFERNQTPSKQ